MLEQAKSRFFLNSSVKAVDPVENLCVLSTATNRINSEMNGAPAAVKGW